MNDDQDKENKKVAYYADLLKASQNQDYEKIVKVCNRILHLFPNETVAFETKAVSYVHLSMFSQALELFDKHPKLSGNLQYERAYCFYRLQRIEDAKEVLEKWKENPFKKKELMCQIYYRLDRFEEAYDMLKDLIKNSDDDMDDERQTNLTAISAALQLVGSDKLVPQGMGDHYDNYERKYNYACGLIGEGRMMEAETLLIEVEKLAVESLTEDGMSEEDLADEVGLVAIQRAFCTHSLGREKEAMGIYSRILKTKPSDAGLVAVASNNILCINKDQNIFDSKKRIKTIYTDGVLPRLNDMQRQGILFNQCLFYLYTQQVDACKETCTELESKYPDLAEEAILIRAALTAKTEGIAATKKLIEPFVKKNPKTAITINLGLVQQALREGKKDEAVSLLKDLGKDNYRPGVISSLVTIHQSQGNIADAAKVLKGAVEYYRKSGVNKDNMNMLWRQTASLMMQQGDHEEAAKSLEDLRRSAPDDPITLAQLIVAYAQYDIIKAKKLSNELPALAQPDVDIGVLESPNWLANVKFIKKAAKGDSVSATPIDSKHTGEKEKVKSKKKKKSKLPANYELDRQPDPERWLPRFERSGYRPKKTRKGRVDVGKGTQGADTVASAMYDMSSKVGQPRQEESPAQAAAWRKDAHKKKKKRK